MEAQVSLPRTRVNQPCAACKMLRRRCDDKCVLSPYFPVEEIEKFARVHKIFGASNFIKMIQMVEEAKREDAVKAMVYEATARLRDPVYGCVGTIFHLQKMVKELQSQLETTRAKAFELRAHRDQLEGILMNIHYLDAAPTVENYGCDDAFFSDGYNISVSQDCGAMPIENNVYQHVNFPF